MPTVVLVDPRGTTRPVESLRELTYLVTNGAWLPQTGTVAEAMVALGGTPPPAPPAQNAGPATIADVVASPEVRAAFVPRDEYVPGEGVTPPNASTTTRGLVELATNTETLTGTDTVRAVTPAGLKAVTDALPAATTATARALPLVTIDTAGGVPITSKETYLNATIRITGDRVVADYTGPTQIRGRGNYTWGLPKKPYRLKLTTAASLLGMTSERDWALLANYTDATMLNTALAFTAGQASDGLAFTPHFRFVDVVLNGDYIGVYQLVELVELSTARIAETAASGTTGLPLTGAYLMEIDQRYVSDPSPGFTTNFGVAIAYDDPSGSVAEQAAYIQNWLTQFEAALYGTSFKDATAGYKPFVDLNSFIDWYLIQELASNQDSYFFSSCKLYKSRDTDTVPGRLHMGPLWDFDLAFANVVNVAHPAEGLYTRPGASWLNRMFADPAFVAALNTRWTAMVARLNDPATGYAATLDRYDTEIRNGRAEDAKRWSIVPLWASNVAAKKAWIARRIAWLTTEYAVISADGSRGDTTAYQGVVANTAAPQVTGTGVAGSALSVSTGTWTPSPESYTYQWRRNGLGISGAVGTSYTPQVSDVGAAITCVVRAQKTAYGSANAISNAVTVTASGGAPALTSTAAPTLSGTATTGQTLTASGGTWSAPPDSYTYQWRRAGTAISGATAQTYVLQAADEGQAITCAVTAVKAGYTSATATSNAVTPSAASATPLTNTAAPVASGTGTVGQTLSVTNGTWSATPDSYAYQWKRDGVAINTATSNTYLLVNADAGTSITCTVTATKAGYTTASATSNAIAVAALGGTGSPSSVSGLIAWYKEVGITQSAGKISAWADQSAQGNNLTQPTAALQPTYGDFTQNSLPMHRFTDHALAGSLAGLTGAPFTFLAVIRTPTDIGGTKTIANVGAASGGRQIRLNGNKQNLTKAQVQSVADGTNTTALTTVYVLTTRYDGSSVTFTMNGAADGGAAFTGTFDNSVIAVGARSVSADEEFIGHIGEVVLFNRALTSSELTQMTQYLGTRWGVTVS